MKNPVKYYSFFFAWLMLILFSQCSHNNDVVQDMSPAEAQKLIIGNNNNPGFMIVDVRTPEEFNSGHLEGSINIDYNADDFDAKIGQLDKNKTFLVYCRSGHRSSKAVSLMKDKGFRSIKNLEGGISNWASENLPLSLK